MKERKLKHINRLSKYNELCTLFGSSEQACFETIKSFMCFAAFLAHSMDLRESLLPGEKTDDIQDHTFSRDEAARGAIYLVALASSENNRILHPDAVTEMCRIFEEYANAGLGVINRWRSDYPTLEPCEVIIEGLKNIGQIRAREKPRFSGGGPIEL